MEWVRDMVFWVAQQVPMSVISKYKILEIKIVC